MDKPKLHYKKRHCRVMLSGLRIWTVNGWKPQHSMAFSHWQTAPKAGIHSASSDTWVGTRHCTRYKTLNLLLASKQLLHGTTVLQIWSKFGRLPKFFKYFWKLSGGWEVLVIPLTQCEPQPYEHQRFLSREEKKKTPESSRDSKTHRVCAWH